MRSFLFLLLFLLAGCAYRFGTPSRPPGGYEMVSIPVFANRTHETGIEVLFTNSLIVEFERSALCKVTPPSNSQITIDGTITDVQYVATSIPEDAGLPAGSVLAAQYRIVVSVNIIVKRNSDHRILWQGNFSKERPYAAPRVGLPIVNSVNPLYNQSARFEQIGFIAQDIMAEAFDRITENF